MTLKKTTAVLLSLMMLGTTAFAEEETELAAYAETQTEIITEAPETEVSATEAPETDTPATETPETEAPVAETSAAETQQETQAEIQTEASETGDTENGTEKSSEKATESEEEPADTETESQETDDGTIYGDPNANVESQGAWEATLPELTGIWRDDIIAIAQSQLGYTESSSNYTMQDGMKKGYTRYGAWYGMPYADWCAMFASFCIYYAEVPDDFPLNSWTVGWADDLSKIGLYETSGYEPVPADLIFFANSGSGINHVGIVEEVIRNEAGEVTEIVTIEGNSSNMVKENRYSPYDGRIVGYGVIPEQPDIPETEPIDINEYSIEDRMLMMGHDVEIEAGYPASCTEDGLTDQWLCSDCGEVLKEHEVIPFLDHDIVIQEEAAPTCTTTGLTKGLFCSGCGKVFLQQEEIPMLGHNYEAVSTRTENGNETTVYICTECGAYTTDPD